MAARVGSGCSESRRAARAVSLTGSRDRPRFAITSRHWAKAMGMETTVFRSSSRTPGLAISWKWMGLKYSPMIRRPEDGSR